MSAPILFRLLIVLQFCISPKIFLAQQQHLTQYTTANGLAGNEVVKSIKDQHGFLWVATHNGLSRFDGRQFKNYSYIPGDTTSLRSNWITDMIMDNNNTLWVSTEWGVCWYDEVYDRFRYIHPRGILTILYKAPLVTAKNGHIWIATESGLYTIDSRQKKLLATTFKRIADPQCITEDSMGNIWVGTRGYGLIKYDPVTKKSSRFQHTLLPAETHFMSVWTVKDQIWVATSEGLLKLSAAENRLFSKKQNGELVNQLMTICYYEENGSRYFLCGTYDKKLYLFDSSTGVFVENKMPDPPTSIYYHCLADGKFTWLSTQTGLYKMKRGEEKFEFYNVNKNVYSSPFYKKILPDKTNKKLVWLASDAGVPTLSLFDMEKNKLIKVITTGLPLGSFNNEVELLQAKDGQLFSFMQHFITIYSAEGDYLKQVIVNKKIFSACFDTAQNIWLGVEDGLAYFNTNSHKINYYTGSFSGTEIENESFPQPFPIVGVAAGKNNLLWLANIKHGLFSFNMSTKKFESYRQPSAGSYETLNRCAAVLLSNDTVWLATMAGISAYLPAQNRFVNYNTNHGLSSTYVYSIAQTTDKNIFGRGNSGVFKFNPTTGYFTNYRLPVSFDEMYYIQNITAGELDAFMGVQGGFAQFSSHTGEEKNQSVFITGVKVNGEPVYKNSSLNLKYNQNTIAFDYTMINFSDDEESFYYKLEGFTDDWIEAAGKKSILYSNLPPGQYVFKIKNGIKEFPGKTASLVFTIEAALWQKLWFKIAVILFAIAFVIFLFIWHSHTLKKKNQEKNHLQSLQLSKYAQELELQKITNFFSERLVHKHTSREVMNEVAKNLIGELGFEDCMIYLWDESRTKLIQYAGHGNKGAVEDVEQKENYHIHRDEGIIGASVKSGEPLIVNDTSLDSRYITADGIERGSELCVPLRDGEEIIGAINIEHSVKNFFTSHHLQIVSAIAAMMVNKLKAVESTHTLQQKQLELSQTNRQLAETELAMLRSQMNPHFIFNSLNSIQKYIWENKEEDAAEYLAKFAKLMRAILENSRKEFVTLKEETDVLKIYTELEHRRSNGRFDYSIHIDKHIDTGKTLIPPMLLQPFIENAIWHGLNKKEEKGHLDISIHHQQNDILCIIEDDGVGRHVHPQPATGKRSLGIEITRQRMERLALDDRSKPSVVIKDKTEEGKPTGTRVEITLPFQTVENA